MVHIHINRKASTQHRVGQPKQFLLKPRSLIETKVARKMISLLLHLLRSRKSRKKCVIVTESNEGSQQNKRGEKNKQSQEKMNNRYEIKKGQRSKAKEES